ncbi:unnamed protein product [Ectocarpus sp. CCAP 1310/34]|nr:unnamed protein product [Ectocarpus sp. CCAP 1310/34]
MKGALHPCEGGRHQKGGRALCTRP